LSISSAWTTIAITPSERPNAAILPGAGEIVAQNVTSEHLDRRPVIRSQILKHLPWLDALPASSIFLSLVICFTFAEVFTGWHWAALGGCPFLLAYLAACWPRIILNGRILLAACACSAVIAAVRPGSGEALIAGASRMIYLPAFVALLGLLRAAAGASAVIAVAGRHLVNQPPSRRYIALSFGGHFFGVLLNIGGLALLVEMVRDANTLKAAGGDPNIVAWRERRMTSACLRGLGAMCFWSPLGVSFNLLLVSVPGVTWGQAGPWGILCAACFIGLGWLFDQFQRPRGLRPRPVAREPGGARAVAVVALHVAAVTGLSGIIEAGLGLPFQTSLLVAVPVYAVCWASAILYSQGEPAPLRSSLTLMVKRGIATFPAYANEVAVFAASGFFGAVIVALVPREAIQGFFHAFTLAPGSLAALLCLTVAGLGMLGLNPMIAATLLASAAAEADLPGLPKSAIVLSIAAGWACTVVASPTNSGLVMASAIIGRPPWTVSVQWNGLFALAALAISATAMICLL
jgi:hypothetical protein